MNNLREGFDFGLKFSVKMPTASDALPVHVSDLPGSRFSQGQRQ
jgi:hypothetical protein